MPSFRTDSADSPAWSTDPGPGFLVVDEPRVRGYLRLTLTRAGYRLFDAEYLGDGSNLSELVGRHVRVALPDVSMPGGRPRGDVRAAPPTPPGLSTVHER